MPPRWPDCRYMQRLPNPNTKLCRNPNVHSLGGMVHLVVCQTCPNVLDEAEPLPAAKIEPGLRQRSLNFAQAVIGHARNQFAKVPSSVQAERFAICRGCGFYDTVKSRCQHERCGCTNFQVKLSWASSECPSGLWHCWTAEPPAFPDEVAEPPAEPAKA